MWLFNILNANMDLFKSSLEFIFIILLATSSFSMPTQESVCHVEHFHDNGKN